MSYYFLQMVDAIGKSAKFWVYAAIGVIATVYYIRKLPETKHKSLEQIEREIGGEETAQAAAA